MLGMRRREFISLLGGAAAAWPITARAHSRRKDAADGVVMPLAGDAEAQRRIMLWCSAPRPGLVRRSRPVIELPLRGWTSRAFARDRRQLVQYQSRRDHHPAAQPVEAAIKATTATIPIVMAWLVMLSDRGYVASLARPGGNVTGQTLIATGQSTKRLQLLQEVSLGINRVAVLWNRNASGHRLQLNEMRSCSPSVRHFFVVTADHNGD